MQEKEMSLARESGEMAVDRGRRAVDLCQECGNELVL